MIVSGKIFEKKSHSLKITIGYHCFGRIHVTEVLDQEQDDHPFCNYNEGDSITAKVLNIKSIASKKHLPISHQNPISHRELELTLKPSKVNLPPPEIGSSPITWLNSNDYLNTSIIVVISEIQQKKQSLGVLVSSDITGTIPAFFLPNQSRSHLNNLAKYYHIGQSLSCRVVYVDNKYKIFTLSLLHDPNIVNKLSEPNNIILGKVIKLVKGRGILMDLGANKKGFVELTEISDTYIKQPVKTIKLGKYHKVLVLPSKDTDNKIPLSMRKSKVKENFDINESINNISYSSLNELKENDIVQGYSKKAIKGQGVYVALSRDIIAYVPHSEVSDKLTDIVEMYFSPGRLVTGKIIKIDTNNTEHPLLMTLKHSLVTGKGDDSKIKISDITKGQKLKGYVKTIKEYGILIEIKHSNRLIGLCHKSEISDKKNLKWEKIFEQGDYVKVIVLEVDPSKNRLKLGMKPSYFTDDDIEFDSDDDDDDTTSDSDSDTNNNIFESSERLLVNEDSSSSDEMEMEIFKNKANINNEDNNNSMDIDNDDSLSSDDSSSDIINNKQQVLQTSGFAFNDFNIEQNNQIHKDNNNNEESEESETESDSEKLSKKAKKLARTKEEEKIIQTEEDLIKGTKTPETIADYERLIIANPNDSYIWIKYMAFLLSITEIEKARNIVERGIKRINLREEGEKLNLWVAYMNLELIYGSKESLLQIIDRALSYNDPKQVYLRLVDIYTNGNKLNEADEIYQKMLKKYKQSKNIWIKYCTFKMINKEFDEAQKIFQRALSLLPQRKHIPLISKFAQLEYKYGDIERGRTMFEGVISNYPKKTDIWSIYIDMEIKYTSDNTTIRRIFERATSLTLSSKKMKFLFTRYLNYEKEYGDENTIEHVKNKVLEYLDKSNK